jgi:HD-GYP domain-containing protein (c-di-GMP phosphodiesterase class II)
MDTRKTPVKAMNSTAAHRSARIMAIADVYDALISERCYKEPIPPEEALKVIKEESGTHFDPKLAEIFLKYIDKT